MASVNGIDNLQMNIHQIGNTIGWSILFNISVSGILIRSHPATPIMHSIIGFIILAIMLASILQILIPFGMNVSVPKNSVLLEIHAIIGLIFIGAVTMLVFGGVFAKMKQENPN